MLSKYTLADIDSILSTNPIIGNLGYSQRISIYNQAQNEIANLFSDESTLITNYTVTDNQIVPRSTKERNTVPELSKDDKETLKLGTFSLGQLIYLIDELDSFDTSQRKMILNMAQDVLTRVKNNYDTLGYYQLWYNSTGDAYSKVGEVRFKTSFITLITELSDYINKIYNTYNDEIVLTKMSGSQAIDGSLSFKANFTTTISTLAADLANESRFKSSFITLITEVSQVTFDGEGRFRTSFVASIYAPTTYTQENESRFRTSFTTAIV